MARARLDFSTLPSFHSTPLFFGLSNELDEQLRRLPTVYGRCNAALRFNSWVGADADMLHVRSEELASMSAACLRAALMEFVGMEEALPRDLPTGTRPLRIWDTRNAMLVALRELRNMQVHLVRDTLVSEIRPAISRIGEVEHHHELTALMIPRDELSRLKDSRNGRSWVRVDFIHAIEWLMDAQEHWGIADVVMRGVWEYARLVAQMHLPAVSLTNVGADGAIEEAATGG